MNQKDIFASVQIIAFNPILKETIDIRTQYFMYLRKLIRIVRWDKGNTQKHRLRFTKMLYVINKKYLHIKKTFFLILTFAVYCLTT